MTMFITCCILISDEHICLITTSYPMPKVRYSIVVNGKQFQKSLCELDLNESMPSVELARATFIYYLVLKIQVDELIIFVSYHVK